MAGDPSGDQAVSWSGAQESNVYALSSEPKEHTYFCPGARLGEPVTGATGQSYVLKFHVPALVPSYTTKILDTFLGCPQGLLNGPSLPEDQKTKTQEIRKSKNEDSQSMQNDFLDAGGHSRHIDSKKSPLLEPRIDAANKDNFCSRHKLKNDCTFIYEAG